MTENNHDMRLLAISGSLRAASSNTAVLQAAAKLAPAGVTIELYRQLGDLPHFNPDFDEERLPVIVAEFRALIGTVDGVLISSPEYARGVPGTLKNALDWLVGSFEFPDKSVALINVSPRATHAQASLTTTLETMSARIVAGACVTLPLLGTSLGADEIVADDELAGPLRKAIATFVDAIEAEAT
jgi:chromate reductase, NAD(P)H dehydrogenase (quinone)